MQQEIVKSVVTTVVVFAVTCAMSGALAFAASAQEQDTTATIRGEVRDPAGRVIPGADVTVWAVEDHRGPRVTSSNAAGVYRFNALAPGDYVVSAAAPGFIGWPQPVQVRSGEDAVVHVSVRIAPGSEEITVSAPTESAAAGLGGAIHGSDLLALPSRTRSYHDAIQFEPGVLMTTNRNSSSLYTQGVKININGAGPRANVFLLDGGSVNDFYSNTLGSVTGVFLGLEAVEEARVRTNSYGASDRGTGGGVVNIVTRSGGNRLRGSAFEFFRDDRLDAKNFFDSEKPDFRRHQLGLSIGGPVARNRTFFFATAERFGERMGVTEVTTVPSMAAREGRLPDPARPGAAIAVDPAIAPYLRLFPVPNGLDFGDGLAELSFQSTQRSREWLAQARIDHALSPSHRLLGRYTLTDGQKTEPSRFPDLDVDWSSRNSFLVVEDRLFFGPDIINTVRFAYARTDLMQSDAEGRLRFEDLAVVPGRPMPQLVIGGMPNVGALPSPTTRALQDRFSWSTDMTLAKRNHLVRWGAILDRFSALSDFQFYWGGRYNFPGIRQFLQAQPTILLIALPGAEPVRQLSSLQFGAYVQDEIAVASSLTLNLGLRWEFATAPREKNGRLVTLRDPERDAELLFGTLLETDKRNIAPRVGFSWVPDARRSVIVRGGAGVYFDVNTLPQITQTLTNPPFYNQATLRRPNLSNPDLSPPPEALSLGIPRYDWRTPMMVHYSLGVEKEIGRRMSVTLGYAGSRGRHLVRAGDVNTPIPERLPDGSVFFPANAPRRNPNFSSIIYRTPDGRSWYDALHVGLRRRLDDGVQLHGAYTFSKTIDEGQGTLPTEALGSSTYWLDPDDPSRDRGLADFHRAHSLVIGGAWGLPMFASAPGIPGALLRGWQVSGTLTVQSGNPFTVGVQDDYSRILARVAVTRPNLKPGMTSDRIIIGGQEQYFDPSAYELQAPGTFGNVGRNSLIGPGVATVDAALIKDFSLPVASRGARVQLRLEAFNLLDRANFGLPQRIVFAGARPDEAPLQNAGRITSTVTPGRQLQLGVKVIW